MMTPHRGAHVLTVLALGLAIGLTGCGGGSDADASPATATAATTAAATPATDECGAAVNEIRAGLSFFDFVESVEVPGCDQARVLTSLAADGADSALAACSIAANEASSHGVSAVSVLSADGIELAAGTNAADCAAAAPK